MSVITRFMVQWGLGFSSIEWRVQRPAAYNSTLSRALTEATASRTSLPVAPVGRSMDETSSGRHLVIFSSSPPVSCLLFVVSLPTRVPDAPRHTSNKTTRTQRVYSCLMALVWRR